ncbi:MAG: citrate lyase subunit alpha [Candidatus Undinarchaeales archaeon]|jgi:citrate lyase subunit alpha/citrate CoA-transferase|nr:citrate lyase subunit alpha [Candidatus Undinarchaeales archaeon]MDP7493653.1 citrate lyase subunit alpha [Candidatus Undinarchaeales archaeon]
MPVNTLGRELPDEIPGYGPVRPYNGQDVETPTGTRHAPPLKVCHPRRDKLLASIDEAIERTGLADGMTVTFHHHFRDGDILLNMVLDRIARKGIKGLTVAPSAFFPVHEPILDHVRSGVVTRLVGSCNGPVGAGVSKGIVPNPVVLRSHGGRVRAVHDGELHIDVAFIAAPECDPYGNVNGVNGPSACGPLGCADIDARYADWVVAVTDNLVPYPATPIVISQTFVDYVVQVDVIGDPKKIVSGTTSITTDPLKLSIAKLAADFIQEHPLFRDGVSFQAGSGGMSLAAMDYINAAMKKRKITADYIVGGTTRVIVEMLRDGTTKKVLDGQAFDTAAIDSLRDNPCHVEIPVDFYANVHNRGNVVDLLDFGILGATEVDLDFNVNVVTHSDGMLLHGIGGHQDVASGADTTIITVPLVRGRRRITPIVNRVTTVSTPGETVDVVVTDRGIAINPRRHDLIEHYRHSKLPIVKIDELHHIALEEANTLPPLATTDRIIAVVENRDGTVLDVVWQPVE